MLSLEAVEKRVSLDGSMTFYRLLVEPLTIPKDLRNLIPDDENPFGSAILMTLPRDSKYSNHLLLGVVIDPGAYEPALSEVLGWSSPKFELPDSDWVFTYAWFNFKLFVPCINCENFDRFLIGTCRCGLTAIKLFKEYVMRRCV